MDVHVIETPELGDRSYVVHDGKTAAVVDPQRDLDRIEAVLSEHNLEVALVLETHLHNDYVSGGLELSQRTGASYVIAAGDGVDFEHQAVSDGDELTAGSLRVRVLATPGHTDGHVAYLVVPDEGSAALFTGGSLLFGTVGRTDLVDTDRTDELTRAQYRSVRRLANEVGPETKVYPTHGFGSFCSSGTSSGADASTIADELRSNEALTVDDEDDFVARLTQGLTAYPRYYAHMGARNRQGPGPADLSPPTPVDRDKLHQRIDAGEWVVDLRSRTAYAAGHINGTVGVELNPNFSTYLGWVIPWGTPVTLIGDTADQVADAQRQLVRIGIDRPAGATTGDPADLAGSEGLHDYPTATFEDVARQRGGAAGVVLDVRRDDERASSHIPGSAHVPLDSLLDRLDELPDEPLWVHCASGFRASIGASLLDRAGRDVVLINDEYASAEKLGLTK